MTRFCFYCYQPASPSITLYRYVRKDGSIKAPVICRPCNTARHRRWMAKHPGKQSEYNRRYEAKKKGRDAK